MRAAVWSPEVGMPLPLRRWQRLHLKHATHEDALVNGSVIELDGSGFTVRWDGRPNQRGDKVHYLYSQADGFVLGNRPYAGEDS